MQNLDNKQPEEWWWLRFNVSMPGGLYRPTTGCPLEREQKLLQSWRFFDNMMRMFQRERIGICAALAESYCRACAYYIFRPEKFLPENVLYRMYQRLIRFWKRVRFWQRGTTNPNRTEVK